MPASWTRVRYAALVIAGMVLLLAGVVAGAAVGNLLAPEDQVSSPMIVGQKNVGGTTQTQIASRNHTAVLRAVQRGNGTAFSGDGASGAGGYFTTQGADASGLAVQNKADEAGIGAGITVDGRANTGIRTTSDGIGLWAESPELALYAAGGVTIVGDISLQGACTGCNGAVLAVSDAVVSLRPGQAVSITGTQEDDTGRLLLSVGLAMPGDVVIGFVDSGMALAQQKDKRGNVVKFYVPSSQVIAPESILRVVISGIVSLAQADVAAGDIAVNDSMGVFATPGVIGKLGPEAPAGQSIGYALGPVENGFVAVFISRH